MLFLSAIDDLYRSSYTNTVFVDAGVSGVVPAYARPDGLTQFGSTIALVLGNSQSFFYRFMLGIKVDIRDKADRVTGIYS